MNLEYTRLDMLVCKFTLKLTSLDSYLEKFTYIVNTLREFCSFIHVYIYFINKKIILIK
jgi:hypothetical protein